MGERGQVIVAWARCAVYTARWEGVCTDAWKNRSCFASVSKVFHFLDSQISVVVKVYRGLDGEMGPGVTNPRPGTVSNRDCHSLTPLHKHSQMDYFAPPES